MKIANKNIIKIVGVKVDNKSSFGEHLENICKSAFFQLIASRIRRDLKSETRWNTHTALLPSCLQPLNNHITK